MKKLINQIIILIIIINIYTHYAHALEQIMINGVRINDIYQNPLHKNLSGDLTLYEDENTQFFYFPEENYFFINTTNDPNFFKLFTIISDLLGVAFPQVCKLNILISAKETNYNICNSNIFMDTNRDSFINSKDWQVFKDYFFGNTFDEKLDINQDKKINSVDMGLLYSQINL